MLPSILLRGPARRRPRQRVEEVERRAHGGDGRALDDELAVDAASVGGRGRERFRPPEGLAALRGALLK